MLASIYVVEAKREIERIFGPWLEWSRDEEVLALLEAVVNALRWRKYRVSYEVSKEKEGT